jgi:hypothetical protein
MGKACSHIVIQIFFTFLPELRACELSQESSSAFVTVSWEESLSRNF